MTTMNQACPERMDLRAVAQYCIDNNLWSTRDWAESLINQPGTINCYYIDTQIVRNMFTVGDNDRMFRDLECEVTTYMGMQKWN